MDSYSTNEMNMDRKRSQATSRPTPIVETKEALHRIRDDVEKILNNSALLSGECDQCRTLKRQLSEAVCAKDRLERQLVELERQLSCGGDAEQSSRRFDSTVISERKQREIDETMLEIKQKGEKESAKLRAELAECRDEIAALKFQADQFRTDFETERRDREAAHGRLADAESQLDALREQLRESDAKLTDAWAQLKRAVAFNAQQTRMLRPTPAYGVQPQHHYYQLVSRGLDVTDDCVTTAPQAESAAGRSASSELVESEALIRQLTSLSTNLEHRSSNRRQRSTRSASPPSRSGAPANAADNLMDFVTMETAAPLNVAARGGSSDDCRPWRLDSNAEVDGADDDENVDIDLLSDSDLLSQSIPTSSSSSPRQYTKKSPTSSAAGNQYCVYHHHRASTTGSFVQ